MEFQKQHFTKAEVEAMVVRNNGAIGMVYMSIFIQGAKRDRYYPIPTASLNECDIKSGQEVTPVQMNELLAHATPLLQAMNNS